ncbi:MAG TPA: hypothetical protein VE978_20655 [Chitinophagales bacterium]|nr:hypothetical protein [Chitinophagales bacterium]
MDVENRIREFTIVVKKSILINSDLDLIIQSLKDLGATQGESAIAISKGANISFQNANDLVLNSTSWASIKNKNDQVRDAFLE